MLNNEMNTLFAEGGMNQQGGTTDPVSGNDVPPGALQNEVRDDISAKLSEGEFVIPADVVRYIGLERLMKIRDEAKAGLARMNDIGQMGNADQVKNPEALHGDEFGQEIDDIMSEVDKESEGHYAVGGVVAVPPPDKDILAKYGINRTAITNSAIDVRVLENDAGQKMYMTYFNGKPSAKIPAGYRESSTPYQAPTYTPATKTTTTDTTATGATTTTDAGGGGPGNEGGGGASVSTGQGIGASPIGIAIGAIANAVSSVSNATPVSVTDAVTTTGVSTSANAAGLAANAAALSADDASISEGVTSGNSTNGIGTVGSTAATAAADNSGNTSADSEGGSSDGSSSGDGGPGDGDGDGGAYAKGGLVAKRPKKSKK